MKLGSLFDGSGTCPLAASAVGIIPAWASEIEPFPKAVTQSRFPKMVHLGDITKMNGAEIEPVDVITFGSPCQNLSIAGNGKGLAGQESSLFFEAIRVIQEMYLARKLTPTECASLQGFEKDWCALVPHKDSAEYKMWGNGMAFPCMLYIMEGVQEVLAERYLDNLFGGDTAEP